MFISNLKKSSKITKKVVKLYAGQWEYDMRHGVGTCYYPNGSVYTGNWEFDMKEGWGTMEYADGSIYQGEFHKENRHGQGVLLLSSGDRYEGMWFNDVKEGPGKFIYRSKRRVYEGEWSLDLPKCGTLKDLPGISGYTSKYPIPRIGLENPELVLEHEKNILKADRLKRIVNG